MQRKNPEATASGFFMVRPTGLEPVRSPTRPSNVRVCLFRQGRISRSFSLRPQRYFSILSVLGRIVNSFFIFFAGFFGPYQSHIKAVFTAVFKIVPLKIR